MPKTVWLKKEGFSTSGINITWTPSAQRLDIGGWYDSFVGIEEQSMTLAEFFQRLGITEKDVKKAMKEIP
jgi:predicted transcriptional regulator